MANPAPTPGTNTFTPKKSTNKAPGDFQRARTALTPEQESATISRFLAIVEQERAQDTKTRVTYACKPSNEAGSTEMGRSHSISNANGATNDIEAAEPKNDNDDDARNNTLLPPPSRAKKTPHSPPTKGLSRSNVPLQRQEGYHSNRLRKCFRMHFSKIRNPTITRREILESAKPIKLFQENARFTTVLPEDALPENSDDAILSGDERAFEQDLTDLNPPEIGGERDETVTAEMDDNHSKKRKFMYGADNEYTPATPEHVVFPPGTVFTAVSTTDEQFFREHCPSTPGHATRFYPHRINAVIHRGRVFFPGTPPSTTSGRTRGISVTSLPDENTPVHGDAINGPRSQRRHWSDVRARSRNRKCR
ncbi:hypothetical protein MHU86_18062 [Fragilaria crotonensis]|nr:hypothetical protein MHU86_18062 [Fragilaria crotonensis]